MQNRNLIDSVQFVDNPEPRCPVALIVDISGSMIGPSTRAVNGALQQFRYEISRDTLAMLRAEIALVTFNHSVDYRDFTSVQNFIPPNSGLMEARRYPWP